MRADRKIEGQTGAQTNREEGRQTHRRTDRKRDRQEVRQIERRVYRQTDRRADRLKNNYSQFSFLCQSQQPSFIKLDHTPHLQQLQQNLHDQSETSHTKRTQYTGHPLSFSTHHVLSGECVSPPAASLCVEIHHLGCKGTPAPTETKRTKLKMSEGPDQHRDLRCCSFRSALSCERC